jgi:3-deoxy-D-manno-octulosonate 8-phosphate phosphatase (KDO 8-P phosphatase)
MSLKDIFEQQGGKFLNSIDEIAFKLNTIRCFIFDWDGVFNNGIKTGSKGSPFSEADSMGLNMLRFSYWLLHNELPIIAIITGENNLTALDFAKREHLNAVYLNAKNKKEYLSKLEQNFSISPNQIAFVFDDILDLSLAEHCGLSFCSKRHASPLFNQFIADHNFCSYISGHEGGQHAVREITELLIGIYGNYDECVSKRMEFTGDYKKYLGLRNAISTLIEKNSD